MTNINQASIETYHKCIKKVCLLKGFYSAF